VLRWRAIWEDAEVVRIRLADAWKRPGTKQPFEFLFALSPNAAASAQHSRPLDYEARAAATENDRYRDPGARMGFIGEPGDELQQTKGDAT
jgi:hypothetical protein